MFGGCQYDNDYTHSKYERIEFHCSSECTSEGSLCQGFIKDIVIQGVKHCYKILCIFSNVLTIENGMSIWLRGNFNGIDYCCQGFKNNMIVNPIVFNPNFNAKQCQKSITNPRATKRNVTSSQKERHAITHTAKELFMIKTNCLKNLDICFVTISVLHNVIQKQMPQTMERTMELWPIIMLRSVCTVKMLVDWLNNYHDSLCEKMGKGAMILDAVEVIIWDTESDGVGGTHALALTREWGFRNLATGHTPNFGQHKPQHGDVIYNLNPIFSLNIWFLILLDLSPILVMVMNIVTCLQIKLP
ncbi:hypothetical protein BC830DRAFT_1223188 [Chytriomyces sp. MP71]|nr:hypothetical protein BC830DRAFT_1223188 [Chytriomyces sp. MP71]